MKSHNPISLFYGGLAALLIAGATLSGCTDNASVQTPNEQDVQAATQAVASSMSDKEDGVMASMYDATSLVDASGMQSMSEASSSPGTYSVASTAADTMRGRFSNFTYSYDPSTGIHHITFSRDVIRPRFHKTLDADLQYIFRDSLGNFIAHPIRDRDSISAVDFIGLKKGTVQATPLQLNQRNSTFTRKDTLYYSGFLSNSDAITINGNHYGSGDVMITTPGGSQIERKYTMTIELTDVTIQKSSIINQDLEQGVTGTLTYNIVIYHSKDGSGSENTLSGTITMTGDGTALLKFKGWRPQYLIKLATGDVTQQ